MKTTSPAVQFKFSDLSKNKEERELFVSTNLEKEERPRSFSVGRTDFFSICLIVSGDMDFTFNFTEQKDLHKNNLVVLSPSTVLQCTSKSGLVSTYVVAFTSRFLAQIGVSRAEIDMMSFFISGHANVVSLSDEETKYIARLIEGMEQRLHVKKEHPFADEIIQHVFKIFLLEIAALGRKYNSNHTPNQHLSRRQDLVFKFGSLVDQNYKKERSVKYYAGKLAITPKYLTELVHEITGRSAGQLIDEKLIHELKFQLNNLELTIAQIAEQLNFSNQSVMGKFFKRQTGMSPLQYRHTF